MWWLTELTEKYDHEMSTKVSIAEQYRIRLRVTALHFRCNDTIFPSPYQQYFKKPAQGRGWETRNSYLLIKFQLQMGNFFFFFFFLPCDLKISTSRWQICGSSQVKMLQPLFYKTTLWRKLKNMEEFLLRLHQKTVNVDSKDRLVWLETMCRNSKLNTLIFIFIFVREIWTFSKGHCLKCLGANESEIHCMGSNLW